MESHERYKKAAEMRNTGATWKEIGIALGGVSAEQARRLAEKHKNILKAPEYEVDTLPASIRNVLKADGCFSKDDVRQRLQDGKIYLISKKSMLIIEQWLANAQSNPRSEAESG